MSLKPSDLAREYFERDLNEEETDILFQALEESAELRDSFMETSRDEWLLNHALNLQHADVQPALIKHNFFRRRIRRIAAMVAIFLSLGGIFVTHWIRVNLAAPVVAVELRPVAEVVDFYVMENDVITVVNHGDVRQLDLDSQLNDGDRIVVPPGARLTYQYLKESTAVSVAGNSLLSISDDEGAKVIRLNRGHLLAEVAQQKPDAPMRVVTDDAEAVVLGTTFEISALGYTHLAVHEGCVRLKSFLHNKAVDVSGGQLMNSLDMVEEGNISFEQIELHPVLSKTLNNPVSDFYLIVDDDRAYTAFLTFDLGTISGRIIEATLQMTVAKSQQDRWGEGLFRLHKVSSNAQPEQLETFGAKRQIAHFQGRVDRDLLLEMDMDPSSLENGINNFELSLDEGGNDCWFAPVKSKTPPRLILKVRKE